MKWDVKLRDGGNMVVEADDLYTDGGALVFQRSPNPGSRDAVYHPFLVVAPQTYLQATRVDDA